MEGKEIGMKPYYKKDKNGNYLIDQKGRKIIGHDLDAITDEFIKFAEKQKFEFWK